MDRPTPDELADTIASLAQGRKIVLHLGCGMYKPEKLHKRFRGGDWFELRFDINRAVKPHIAGDMRDLSMMHAGLVDAVWNSHTLEHLYAHEVVPALKEWKRVLKAEGTILMTLPDLQTVAAQVAQGNLEEGLYASPAGPISALDVMYGFSGDLAKGNHYMAHRTGFTAQTLGHKLVDAGFTGIKVVVKGFDLWAEGRKPREGEKPSSAIAITRDKPVEVPGQQRHPGQLWKGKRADELDVPPQEV